MRAGDLDCRVMLQARVLRKGDSGEEVEQWSDARRVWCAKRDMRAAERFTGNETVAEVETVFKARWSAVKEVRPDTHRIVFRDVVYAILGRTELGRRDAVEFACAARGEAAYG
jgi:SPP1 family predicted phage head-tail adaptor